VTTITCPAPNLSGLAPPAARSMVPGARIPPQPGDWKYRTVAGRGWTLAMGMFIAALAHVVFLYGTNRKPAPPPRLVDDTPIIQMAMPDLPEEEEDQPADLVEEAEMPAGIAVPTLAEYLTAVPVDAFVQPMQFTPPSSGDLSGAKLSTIPIHMTRGTGKVQSLGQIFNLADLDRPPTAVFQATPPYPFELKRQGVEGQVTVEFIVDAKGEVVQAKAIASTNPGFEEAAVVGVLKWKFKPGRKGGRNVASRMLVPIKFTITED
jgi:periplasmic protein TonB